MRSSMSLRARLLVILISLVFITAAGGSVMMWSTYRMDHLLKAVIDQDVAALQAAEALENALINQKGFVSYYFLDGNPQWLQKLGEYRLAFKERLNRVRRFEQNALESKTIDMIGAEYAEYIRNKDQVIEFYRAGERRAGAELHSNVRMHFFKILDLCEEYKAICRERIDQTRMRTQVETKRLRAAAVGAVWTAILLGGLFAFILLRQVLNPLRKLALDGSARGNQAKSTHEIEAVSERVQTLLHDVDATRTQLEKSKEHLVQSEKLALVGRLAAGVAHSVRNPLTSVKMRLFSLERTLELTETQREDFHVISEEIRNVDHIVQNFLEFSRPPKLKMQKVSPSDVVDMALQLLRHRLDSYDAVVTLGRQKRLPRILADPEQLKEAFVNLLVNACEAMGIGGHIEIFEQEGLIEPLGRAVVIRIVDNGPGVPPEIRDKLFQPFFSTKEEGTGLGLSIAERIVRDHGGWLNFVSRKGKGTSFTITLPCEEA